jgi:hypothetical protein
MTSNNYLGPAIGEQIDHGLHVYKYKDLPFDKK